MSTVTHVPSSNITTGYHSGTAAPGNVFNRHFPTSRTSAGILAEIAALNGQPGTIHLLPGTWTIDADLTTPATVRLVAEHNARMVAAGGTLTINGDFDAPLAQVFYGFAAGGVTFSRATEVMPQWFGAEGADDIDSTAALQLSLDAVRDACGTVRITPSSRPYRHTGLTIYSGVALIGSGMSALGEGGSELRLIADTAHAIYGADVRNVTIENLNITGSAGSSLGNYDGVYFEQTGSTAIANLSLRNLFVSGFSRHGVHIEDPITSTFFNVRSQSNGGLGFYFDEGTSLALLSCYGNGCDGGGFYLNNIHYSMLSACACDSSGDAYRLQSCSSVSLIGCGSEAASSGANGFVISGGSDNGVYHCRVLGNQASAFWATGGAIRAMFLGCRENAPGAGATASHRVDAGCTATVINPSATTPASYAANTTTLLSTNGITIPSQSTVGASIQRGSTTNYASFTLGTSGTDYWAVQMRNDSTNDGFIQNVARGLCAMRVEDRATAINMSLLTSAKEYGGGVGVFHVPEASTVPTTNPASGLVLYVEGGQLKARNASGTVFVLSTTS